MNVPTLNSEWDALTPDQQAQWRGNTDPWAGPVDPVAHERWVKRWRAQQSSRAVQREQQADACGCWANDCAECGPRRADGKRPAPGSIRASALRSDALLQRAKERHALATRAVLP